MCLPIKSGGCGLGFVDNTITSVFVAHMEETMDVLKNIFIDAPYLELLDTSVPLPED